MNWRASKTVEVDEIWQGLANTNLEINSILSLLCEQAKNNPIVYKRSIIWAANKKYDEWCMKKVLDPSNDNVRNFLYFYIIILTFIFLSFYFIIILDCYIYINSS